jgi:hypothetical protein
MKNIFTVLKKAKKRGVPGVNSIKKTPTYVGVL